MAVSFQLEPDPGLLALIAKTVIVDCNQPMKISSQNTLRALCEELFATARKRVTHRWRRLSKEFDNWPTLRIPACAGEVGALYLSSGHLQRKCLIFTQNWSPFPITPLLNASTEEGALKSRPVLPEKCREGWITKIYMVATSANCALLFSFSLGNAEDAPKRAKALGAIWPCIAAVRPSRHGQGPWGQRGSALKS